MNIIALRLRYTQILIIGLLAVSLCVTTQSLSGGPSQFGNNLWGRTFLVASFTRLKLKLGDRIFPQAVIGKDGWVEYTGNGNLDGYQNAFQNPPSALKITQEDLKEFNQELKKRNITLIVVIAPNKATIYSDKLPDEISKIKPESKLDLLTAYLQKHGPPVLIDLRPALQEWRQKQDVYYKTDTHWNSYGAFIAYREIMKELSKTYTQFAPKNISDFKVKNLPPSLHELARITGATHLPEGWVKITPKQEDLSQTSVTVSEDMEIFLQTSVTEKNSPTLLMYRDSFGEGIKDLLSPHFSKMTLIKLDSKYPDMLSLKLIDSIKPDVVIVEIVERSFNRRRLDIFLKGMLSKE